MSSFTIIANTAQFAAQITQLEQRVTSLQPFYEDTGRALKEQIDTFFKTGIGADGQPWQANAFSTIQGYLKEKKGYKKDGSLSVRGLKMASSKKVLQGITGRLRKEIYYNTTNRSLILGSPLEWAGIHTFGGQFKACGKTPLVMPARPFMPVDKAGNLYPKAAAIIQRRLLIHLQNATR